MTVNRFMKVKISCLWIKILMLIHLFIFSGHKYICMYVELLNANWYFIWTLFRTFLLARWQRCGSGKKVNNLVSRAMTENSSSEGKEEHLVIGGDVIASETSLQITDTSPVAIPIVDIEDTHSLDSASVFSSTTTTTTRSKSKSPNTRKLRRLCRRAKAPKMVQPSYKYRWFQCQRRHWSCFIYLNIPLAAIMCARITIIKYLAFSSIPIWIEAKPCSPLWVKIVSLSMNALKIILKPSLAMQTPYVYCRFMQIRM